MPNPDPSLQAALWPELAPQPPARRAKAAPSPERACPVCGGAFTGPARQRYCSPACRVAAGRPASGDPGRRKKAAGAATAAPTDAPGVAGPVPGPLAATPPATPPARGAPAELTAARRLALAWQLLGAQRPAALWQALAADEQTRAAATSLALYQWARDLETFARRQRGSGAPAGDGGE
jgi:hypothetical protein